MESTCSLTFLFLLPHSNLFYCHSHILFYSKTPKTSLLLTISIYLTSFYHTLFTVFLIYFFSFNVQNIFFYRLQGLSPMASPTDLDMSFISPMMRQQHSNGHLQGPIVHHSHSSSSSSSSNKFNSSSSSSSNSRSSKLRRIAPRQQPSSQHEAVGGGPIGMAGHANKTPALGGANPERTKRVMLTKRERQRQVQKMLEEAAVGKSPIKIGIHNSSMSPLDIEGRSGDGTNEMLQRDQEEMLNLIMKTPQPTPAKAAKA